MREAITDVSFLGCDRLEGLSRVALTALALLPTTPPPPRGAVCSPRYVIHISALYVYKLSGEAGLAVGLKGLGSRVVGL